MLILLLLVALCSSSLALPFGNSSVLVDRDWQKIRDEILEVIRFQDERIRQLETELLAMETEGTHQAKNERSAMPSSCGDLWNVGYEMAGFYPVLLENKLQFVYCDMSDYTAFTVGNIDLKEGVHFYMHRNGEYKNDNKPVIISYSTRLVAHPAFDAAIGRFTAPKSGMYFFHFSCYAYTASVFGDNTSEKTKVVMLVNSAEVAYNYAFSDYSTDRTLAFTATLHLMEGDNVETRFEYGNIRNPYFGGSLIEADTSV